MVQLGSLAHDNVTGYKGLAVVRQEHLHGCVHIGLQPTELNKDGKPQRVEYFDEQKVVVDDTSRCAEAVTPNVAEPIEIGWLVRDKITELQGIVVVKFTDMWGQTDVFIQPKGLGKDGEPRKAYAAKEPQCAIIDRCPVEVSPNNSARTGSCEISERETFERNTFEIENRGASENLMAA